MSLRNSGSGAGEMVEPPVFTDVQNAYVDANFSIIEQTEDVVYFEIFAESVDAIEKEVNLSLSTETSDNDNQFFEVTGTSSDNSLKFAFQVPPDFENPVDLDGDNNYTVAVVAECAGPPPPNFSRSGWKMFCFIRKLNLFLLTIHLPRAIRWF